MLVGEKVKVVALSTYTGWVGKVNKVRRYPGSLFPVEVYFHKENRTIFFDDNELEVVE